MYKLVAEVWKHGWVGEVSSLEFATLEAAEQAMADWGRFGVDNTCDEADRICIYDATMRPVRVWSPRERRPIEVTDGPPG